MSAFATEQVSGSGEPRSRHDSLKMACPTNVSLHNTRGQSLSNGREPLLITADDGRAGALLRVLAAAAAPTQVIVFSHHAQLVDVARNAVGSDGFMLHMIELAASIPA